MRSEAGLLGSACRRKAAPSEPAFQVSAQLASEVSSGKPAELLTRIAAGPGFKLNTDYPISFRPEGSSTGIRFEKQRLQPRHLPHREAEGRRRRRRPLTASG